MAGPVKVTGPRLLVVEGWNDRAFYYALMDHLGMEKPQILTTEGRTPMASFLGDLPADAAGFRKVVGSMGVIADADNSPQAAFASLCGGLRQGGLAVPERPGEWAGERPRVGVFLQPRQGQAGMLETLLNEAVMTDEAFACIDPFLECVRGLRAPPKNLTKARAQAYLASREEPGLSIGVAAQKGYWNFEHPAYAEVKAFLKTL